MGVEESKETYSFSTARYLKAIRDFAVPLEVQSGEYPSRALHAPAQVQVSPRHGCGTMIVRARRDASQSSRGSPHTVLS